ncbi:MAG TPA: endonuclease/exonuclease/phosphatase family protein [Niabella sp.]|nr:endonuclease/exonuclease/phosphatase family protein [Niabella sp.]
MNRILTCLLLISALFLSVSCTSKKAQQGSNSKNIIKVMTYNVHHCNPPDKKGIIDVDGTAAVIKNQNADLVALQEIDVNTGRSGKINQAALLAQKAGYPFYYFAKAMDYDGGRYGLAILSKYPLANAKTHLLPSDNSKRDEPRVLAEATVKWPGGKDFHFCSTHLEAFNKKSRTLQMQEINQIAGKSSIPFIVAGDFNAFEGSEVINILDQQFNRTCDKCPNTFDEEGERGAIDFIAFRKNDPFVTKSHQVIPEKTASDHMPVVATIEIR